MKAVAQQTSLAELGMDSMMAVEIKQTLEREYDIVLTAQDIRNLNFAKLMEIRDKNLEREQAEMQQNNEQTTEISGIHLMILGKEEISIEICMDLRTRMNPRLIKAFLLPGIQGCGNIFNPLASKIKSIASVLQYGIINIGHSCMSISEYADFLLPVRIQKGINKMKQSLDISFKCFCLEIFVSADIGFIGIFSMSYQRRKSREVLC